MSTELILTPDALTGIMDRGYLLSQETDPHFPIRLSALGHCPRQLRMLLAGVEKREYTPRSLRVFEQGHQRGAALADAFRRGFWPFATEVLDNAPAVNIEHSLRFKLLIEHTSWLSTRIHGKLAEDVLAGCKAWLGQAYSEDESAVEDVWLPLRIVDGYLQIRGRSDLLILDHEHKVFWVTDFKTKNSWGFKKLEDEGVGVDYEVQVLAYTRALGEEYEGWRCGGAYVFYEDHDRRSHKVLDVPLIGSAHVLDDALGDVEHLLRNWAKQGPPTEAPATYADKKAWTKAKHKGALGCLPWQCNYCSIGPEAGECLPKTLGLNDIRTPGADVPKWEVVG